MLDFPSLLYKGLRILMFQLSGVYCKGIHIGSCSKGSLRAPLRDLFRDP